MPLTQERLHALLDYNPLTGEFIRKIPRGRASAGSVAGVFSRGYRVIRIDGVSYQSGRLAILWMTGQFPEATVDHHNLDKADDRWGNLRPATWSQQGANRRAYGRVGLKGVYWVWNRKKFCAQIGVNGRHIYLGYFDDPEAAHSAYRAAATKYFGEFARC